MGNEEYKLARRMRRVSVRTVELATVVGVNPLVLKIGDAIYSSAEWLMYAPVYRLEDAMLTTGALTGASVSCPEGNASAISFQSGTLQEMKAAGAFSVGDMLAVQETAGASAFIILAKLEEVASDA